jgi:hypothetical protein
LQLCPPGIYSTFMATDEEARFMAGVLGVPLPAIPPQMRELVRRGLTAFLPALIRHLDDRRPTRLTVGDSPILMNRAFGDEYDPGRVRPAISPACTVVTKNAARAPGNK